MFIFFLAIANAFGVYKDFSEPPYPSFTRWQYLPLTKDHHDRMPTQPPSDWYNATFRIPLYATAVQFTIKYQTDVVTENVIYYGVDYYNVYVSLVWWGYPWVLYTGWLINQNVTQLNINA